MTVLPCAERLDVAHMLRDRDLVLLLEEDAKALSLVAPPNDHADLCALRKRVLAWVTVNRADRAKDDDVAQMLHLLRQYLDRRCALVGLRLRMYAA